MNALRIGLCYDLKADYLAAGFAPHDVMEFDEEDTVAEIAGALAGLGHSVDRIGRGTELARRLAAGERWDLVFNLAEGVRGRSREAQVPALCEMFDQPYTFSDPLTCAVTLDKALAKRVVRDSGLPTPPFEVVETDRRRPRRSPWSRRFSSSPSPRGARRGSRTAPGFPGAASCANAARELIRLFRQPVLVERYLPGREMTVGMVGNGAEARVVGVMEVVFRNGRTPPTPRSTRTSTSNGSSTASSTASPSRAAPARWRSAPIAPWRAGMRPGSTCAATATASPASSK